MRVGAIAQTLPRADYKLKNSDMDKYEIEEWEANHDMPHEELMDERGIDYSDLSKEIQRKIRAYDLIYEEALKDGYIDEQEEKLLITASFKIAQKIKREHPLDA